MAWRLFLPTPKRKPSQKKSPGLSAGAKIFSMS
jgi:hypothetical protein